MCVICKDNSSRTYTHSRTSAHKKKLFAVMKAKLASGYYYRL